MNKTVDLRDLLAELIRKTPPGTISRTADHMENEAQATANAARRLSAIKRLCERPIEHFDIGARSGIAETLNAYLPVLSVTMVEPEETEAQHLRDSGYKVVDRPVSATWDASETLFITRKIGASSLLPPDPEVADFFASGDDRFEVLEEIQCKTTTIDKIAEGFGTPVDDLKLDIQGGEKNALLGMKIQRPFHVTIEILTVKLYQGQAEFFELGRMFHERGYILCDLKIPVRRSGGGLGVTDPILGEFGRGLPICGDACFIPDWMRPDGRRIIARDPRKWAAVLIMRGYGDLVEGICRQEWFDDGKEILSLMAE